MKMTNNKHRMITVLVVLSILLSTVLLSGCRVILEEALNVILDVFIYEDMPKPDNAPEYMVDSTHRDHVHFDDMVYLRPNAAGVAARIDEILLDIKNADDTSELEAQLTEVDDLVNNYFTMYTLSIIKNDLDKSDAYWLDEYNYLADGFVDVHRATTAFLRYLFESPLREIIELTREDYFDSMAEVDFVTNETKSLYEMETELVRQYNEMLFEGAVDVGGELLSLADIQEMDYGNDFLEAVDLWVMIYTPQLCEIYIELVKLRAEIAGILGFDNYIDMVYSENGSGYTPDMAREFLDEIKSEIVPSFAKAEKGGFFYFPDVYMEYTEMLDMARDILYDLSPDFLDSFYVMKQYGLIDSQPGLTKEQGAYVIYIKNYELPFLFMSYTGDMHSITYFAHEFAHFHDDYSTMWGNPYQMDVAEIFSQSMELLFSDYFPAYLGGRIGYYMRHDTLSETLLIFLTQPFYTAIEMRAYEAPHLLTVETLNDIARDEYMKFGHNMLFGDEEVSILDWILNPQVVERPFHTLTYSTSAAISLQIWEIAQTDKSRAVELYLDMLNESSNYGFLELVEYAGLSSPFTPGTVSKIARMVDKYIVNEDWKHDLAA